MVQRWGAVLPARRLSRLQAALPDRAGTALRTTKDPAKLHSGAGLRPVPKWRSSLSPFSPSSGSGPRSGGEEPALSALLSRQEGDTAWRKRAVTGSQLALLAERLESLRGCTDLDINQKLCIHVTPTPSPPSLNLRKKERKQLQGGLRASSCLFHTQAASSSLRLIGDLQQQSTRIIKMSQQVGWPGNQQLFLFWFNHQQKSRFNRPASTPSHEMYITMYIVTDVYITTTCFHTLLSKHTELSRYQKYTLQQLQESSSEIGGVFVYWNKVL